MEINYSGKSVRKCRNSSGDVNVERYFNTEEKFTWIREKARYKDVSEIIKYEKMEIGMTCG